MESLRLQDGRPCLPWRVSILGIQPASWRRLPPTAVAEALQTFETFFLKGSDTQTFAVLRGQSWLVCVPALVEGGGRIRPPGGAPSPRRCSGPRVQPPPAGPPAARWPRCASAPGRRSGACGQGLTRVRVGAVLSVQLGLVPRLQAPFRQETTVSHAGQLYIMMTHKHCSWLCVRKL